MQTMHLPCVEVNTVSKRIETSFHLNHVMYEFQRVCPKHFLSLWYVRPKPCTYLASRLTLSPNETKQASTWPMSPRSSIGCAQSDFQAYCMFAGNRAPVLPQEYYYLQTDQNELLFDPRHLEVPSGVSKMISEPMVHSSQTKHRSCTKINTISKWTKTSFHLIHVT
jgi:hypothetical protein